MNPASRHLAEWFVFRASGLGFCLRDSALIDSRSRSIPNLKVPEQLADFKRRMGAFCRDRMAAYQIPRLVEISDDEQYGSRFKKLRNA